MTNSALMNLKTRQLQPELMDDPNLDSGEHQNALQGLARTHLLTRTSAQLWKQILNRTEISNNKPISVLDVGCGDGFILQQIHRLATRSSRNVSLAGCDFSPTAVSLARQSAERKQIPIEFFQIDITADELPASDIIINSLFLHHFTEDQVVAILRKFDSVARTAVIVQDLARTRLGYGLCLLGTRLLSRSSIVHTDGLLSVQAAFSVEEMERIVKRSDIANAQISRQWPERISVAWSTQRSAR